MMFRPALFLALVAMAIARPNPSSLKTIASASGSKSSIKSPSQKLAEKNNSPSVASIIESSPVSQGVSQSEAPSPAPSQDQDITDIHLQYSQGLIENLPKKVVPAVVKESEVLAAPSSIQNELVKPATYSAVLTESQPKVSVINEQVSSPVNPQLVSEIQPVLALNPTSVETPVEKPVEKILEKPVEVSETSKQLVASDPVDAPVSNSITSPNQIVVPVQPVDTPVSPVDKVVQPVVTVQADKAPEQPVNQVSNVFAQPQVESIGPITKTVTEIEMKPVALSPVVPEVDSSKQVQPNLLNSVASPDIQTLIAQPEVIEPSKVSPILNVPVEVHNPVVPETEKLSAPVSIIPEKVESVLVQAHPVESVSVQTHSIETVPLQANPVEVQPKQVDSRVVLPAEAIPSSIPNTPVQAIPTPDHNLPDLVKNNPVSPVVESVVIPEKI